MLIDYDSKNDILYVRFDDSSKAIGKPIKDLNSKYSAIIFCEEDKPNDITGITIFDFILKGGTFEWTNLSQTLKSME